MKTIIGMSLALLVIHTASRLHAAPKDIAINEVMAADYDSDIFKDIDDLQTDWIELFNPTDQAVNISGCFLTDNLDTLAKWKFPSSIIISAQSYLLVWAAGDTTKAKLAGNFKLDRDGEVAAYNIDCCSNLGRQGVESD